MTSIKNKIRGNMNQSSANFPAASYDTLHRANIRSPASFLFCLTFVDQGHSSTVNDNVWPGGPEYREHLVGVTNVHLVIFIRIKRKGTLASRRGNELNVLF